MKTSFSLNKHFFRQKKFDDQVSHMRSEQILNPKKKFFWQITGSEYHDFDIGKGCLTPSEIIISHLTILSKFLNKVMDVLGASSFLVCTCDHGQSNLMQPAMIF